MRKAQGSLEYLIIIAAVLAIAAVVVMFLTGALGGTTAGGNIAQCKVAAAGCKTDLDTAGVTGASCLKACKSECTNGAGLDLLSGAAPTYAADGYTATAPATSAVYQCQHGTTPM